MGGVTGTVCFMTWLTCDMGGVTGTVCFMTWLTCDMGGVTDTVLHDMVDMGAAP